MAEANGHRILAINIGSSSLKAALYQIGQEESLLVIASVNRLGEPDSRMQIKDGGGGSIFEQQGNYSNPSAALDALLTWLEQNQSGHPLNAVGHRIVHGGQNYTNPQLITPELVEALRQLMPLDPDHLPAEIEGIEFISRKYPDLSQVACFDTAFHSQMPAHSRIYALPRYFYSEGIMRYGFHGLSYEYIVQELRRLEGPVAEGRVIIAHLGNGASMAAVYGGRSMDTSMGFTPAEGLVMGTRSGDVDPGVLLYLLQERKMSADSMNDVINRQSGLLGLSGISNDMQDLMSKDNPAASQAVDLFCYRAKKYLGAYAAVLGGLDVFVFTGGIGEHAGKIRETICSEMGFLGVELDQSLNLKDAPTISRQNSRVKIRVIATNENLMVARHTARVLKRSGHVN